MPDILILADDLTGAADTGAQFVLAGYPTLLLLEPDQYSSATVLVISSETRGLSSEESTAGVRSVLNNLTKHSPLSDFQLIYKKIDSTLRGHPAQELDVLLKMSTEQRVLVAPAYPAQGRVTRKGVVWVHGQPLAQTSFAVEAGNGDLRLIFGDNTGQLPIEVIRQGEAAVRAELRKERYLILADAETDADLLTLARAAIQEDIRVFCGSAGLAKALSSIPCKGNQDLNFHLPRYHGSQRKEKLPIILAVAGSLDSTTATQVAYAHHHGAEIVTPPKIFFQDSGSAGLEETSGRLASIYNRGKIAILTTISQTEETTLHPGRDIANKLAQAVVHNLPQSVQVGLFLTGGDTALAVCRALGCQYLWLGGEVEPGIPWSQSGRFTVVSKAGGFGREDAIMNGLNWLKTDRTSSL